MRIPGKHLEKFIAEIAAECMSSQAERIQRGATFKNYYLYGASNQRDTATYNKTYAYLDDLESLLYSPVSLKFSITDPELPNVKEKAKGDAASADLRKLARRSDTDTMVSDGVKWGLIKGKAFIKQLWKGEGFAPVLIQPESMGVLQENRSTLDVDMDAFNHRMFISQFEFRRMIAGHPDEAKLIRKAAQYSRKGGDAQSLEMNAGMQIVVGASQPYRGPNDVQSGARNTVDWLGSIGPQMSADMRASLLQMDEVWIWDDERENWATFWLVGDDMLVRGKYQTTNNLSWNTESMADSPYLKGKHPFIEICPNPLDGYFWGWPEIANVALLQEAINARMTGINRLLRMQEDPPKFFKGGAGVNQQVVAKLNKPGGWWTDSMPTADVKNVAPEIPAGTWESLHEYIEMMNDIAGKPPVTRGRGEAGVRSQGHAEVLVQQSSPRFKDRALIVERAVEALGALMLDLAKAHEADKLVAWVPQAAAGHEAAKVSDLITPPAPGLVPIYFRYADLDESVTLTVDSHSSSPVFAAEAKQLLFDLLKIGAVSPEDVLQRSDISGVEQLVAELIRREAAKQAQLAELERNDPQAAFKLLAGGKKK